MVFAQMAVTEAGRGRDVDLDLEPTAHSCLYTLCADPCLRSIDNPHRVACSLRSAVLSAVTEVYRLSRLKGKEVQLTRAFVRLRQSPSDLLTSP
jgi:hypothetical protein